MRLWKLAQTYGDNVGDDGNERSGSGTSRKRIEGGSTSVDGSNDFVDNFFGACVVGAAVELGGDSTDLVAEVGDSILDVRNGPLRGNLGHCAGEGHSTGSEDSEDGRETHDEEA